MCWLTCRRFWNDTVWGRRCQKGTGIQWSEWQSVADAGEMPRGTWTEGGAS